MSEEFKKASEYGFDEQAVIGAAKRLGVQWTPWMGDWFTSWSPRNDNNNAEGSWFQWVHLAALILGHPFTKVVAPELFRDDLAARTDIYDETGARLDKDDIARFLQGGQAPPSSEPKEGE